MRRLLLVCTLALPAACGNKTAGPSAAAAVDAFYRAYLDAKPGARRPDAPLSASFAALISRDLEVCRAKAGTDVCGWGADGDPYLAAQETGPGLSYTSSGFRAAEVSPGVVETSFNVYPSDKGHKDFYDRELRYFMVREGGEWRVDDIGYKGGTAREILKAEIALYLAPAGSGPGKR